MRLPFPRTNAIRGVLLALVATCLADSAGAATPSAPYATYTVTWEWLATAPSTPSVKIAGSDGNALKTIDLTTGDRLRFTAATKGALVVRTLTPTYHCEQDTGEEDCDGFIFKTCHSIYRPINRDGETLKVSVNVFKQLIPSLVYRSSKRPQVLKLPLPLKADMQNFVVPEKGTLQAVAVQFDPASLDPTQQSPTPTPDETRRFDGQSNSRCQGPGMRARDQKVDVKAQVKAPPPVSLNVELFRNK